MYKICIICIQCIFWNYPNCPQHKIKKKNYNNTLITIILKMSCDEIVYEQSLEYTKLYLQKKKKFI